MAINLETVGRAMWADRRLKPPGIEVSASHRRPDSARHRRPAVSGEVAAQPSLALDPRSQPDSPEEDRHFEMPFSEADPGVMAELLAEDVGICSPGKDPASPSRGSLRAREQCGL